MELLVETKIMSAKRLEKLLKECDELIRMLVAAVRTLKRRREQSRHPSSLVPATNMAPSFIFHLWFVDPTLYKDER